MDTVEVFESGDGSNSSFVLEDGEDVGANVILSTASPPPLRHKPVQVVQVISSRIHDQHQKSVQVSPLKLRGQPLELSQPVVVQDPISDYLIQTLKEEGSDEHHYVMGEAAQSLVNVTESSEMHPQPALKQVVHYELLYPGGPIEQVKVEHVIDEHDYVPLPEAGKEYFCGVCGKSYTSEKSVRQHMTRTHGVADAAERPKMKRKQQLKKIVCEACGKKYAKKREQPLKMVVCQACGQKFASAAALKYHQRVHTGEKPFNCPECPKAFTMPLFLQIHLRTHTGERPYPCPNCPKAFSNQAALLRHSRVHSGIKPYTCEECGKSFTQSNSRKLHIRTVHLKLPAPYMSKQRKLRKHRRNPSEVSNALSEVEATFDTDSQTEYPRQMSYVIENGSLDESYVVAYNRATHH